MRLVHLAVATGAMFASVCAFGQEPVRRATRGSFLMRSTVAHKDLLQWRVGYSNAKLSIAEAAGMADSLGLDYLHIHSAQVGEDLAAVKRALGEWRMRVSVVEVEDIRDEAAARRWAALAKDLGAEVVLAPASASMLDKLERFATESGVRFALRRNDAGQPLSSRSPVLVLDHAPVARLTKVLQETYRAGVKPAYFAVSDKAEAETFEAAVQPILGQHVVALSKRTPITPTTTVSAADRQKIEAALPRQAPARPKKPRRLLILDLCVAGYIHASIPHANLALELLGKRTGAYEPVFSNDLDNLKYPRIKDFDAVFLNDTVGEVFPDPAVREGLLRYVREGGGVGALHGATYAARNWPEFGELIGAMDAPHRIEPAVLKIEDPSHPLTKAFPSKEFPYTEEYYRFYDEGPTAFYSRDKLRVLLSIDTTKTDMSKANLLQRKDGDYGLAWIRSYGNGRVFTNAMGHTTEFFMTPQLSAHVLAGIQFILGDLPADTTPSGRLSPK